MPGKTGEYLNTSHRNINYAYSADDFSYMSEGFPDSKSPIWGLVQLAALAIILPASIAHSGPPAAESHANL